MVHGNNSIWCQSRYSGLGRFPEIATGDLFSLSGGGGGGTFPLPYSREHPQLEIA